jgi:hypothetical protein
MNKKLIFILLFFGLAGSGLLFGLPQGVHKAILVEKEIHIGPDERQENIVIISGSALIEGLIEENVVALGGRVTLSGRVQHDVFGLGAQVVLKSTAVVEGDVVCIGGTLDKEPGCRVEGDTTYFKVSTLIPKFAGGWKGFFSLSLVPFILIFKLIMVFIWFLIILVVVHVIPQRVTFASDRIRKDFGPVMGTGVLSVIIFSFLVIIAALLCIILIGIPILLALLAAQFFITIFGRVAVYHFFGDSLAKAFGQSKASPLGAAMLGLLVVSFFTFIPFLGLLFSLFIEFLVFGVAIRTKFGAMENWFHKPTV